MSKQLKQYESSKLFYTEYLYKLVLRNELSTIFRNEFSKKEKLSYARVQLDSLTEQYQNNQPLIKKQFRSDLVVNLHDYFDAMTVYTTLKNSNDYKIRIDPYSSISLFSNNKKFLTTLSDQLHTSCIKWWEPNVDHINLLTSAVKIQIVDSVPNLPLKVWFNSKKIDSGFADWIRANKDKCKIGKIALDSLDNYGYLNGLYVYIRDDKVLNLVTLLAGSSIRSVEKLVYRGDIDKYKYDSE